jgi:hypothetical protein
VPDNTRIRLRNIVIVPAKDARRLNREL